MHPIVEYIKNSWKEHRNNSDKKNTFAVNRYIFPQIVDMLSDCKDIAFISIGETKGCIEYNKFEDYGHYLKDSENVLNIDFDDLECDFTFEGYNFKAITDEQTVQIYALSVIAGQERAEVQQFQSFFCRCFLTNMKNVKRTE